MRKLDRLDEIGEALKDSSGSIILNIDRLIQGKLSRNNFTWTMMLLLYSTLFIGIICIKEGKHEEDKAIIEAKMKAYSNQVLIWKDSILETRTIKGLK